MFATYIQTKAALISGFLLSSSIGFAAPMQVSADIDAIYTPRGFTNADQAEVVVTGVFPNGCYSLNGSDYMIDAVSETIYVETKALYDAEQFCIQALVPFLDTITIDEALPAGTYEVQAMRQQDVFAELAIAQRQEESPEVLFAPIEYANIEEDPVSGRQVLVLEGEYPHFYIGCMLISDIDIAFEDNGLVNVQPRAILTEGAACAPENYDYQFKVRKGLPQPTSGEGVLYVRGYLGQSYANFLNL